MSRVVSNFARNNRFQLNGEKSGVMIFNADKAARQAVADIRWTLFGNRVKVTDKYKYLGTMTTTNINKNFGQTQTLKFVGVKKILVMFNHNFRSSSLGPVN